MRWLIPILVCVSCVRATPAPPPPVPDPVNVPDGCLEPLSGPWRYAGDEAWQYSADDDGGTLVLHVTHTARADAGFVPRKFRKGPEKVVLAPGEAALMLADAGEVVIDGGVADAGAVVHADIRVELQRTSHGFVGFTLAPVLHPSGRTCEGRFETTVLSCADGGLVIQSAAATALGEECQSPPRPRPPEPLIHTLIRPPFVADAG